MLEIGAELEGYAEQPGLSINATGSGLRRGPHWDVNPEFAAHVMKATSVNRPVVLKGRSGNRSLDAGHALEESGFTKVYKVLHGFERELDTNHHRGTKTAGRHAGLPWEQC